MSGEIPPEIGDLRTLEYLDLSDNDLTGVIPSELGQLDSLWNLDLEKNDLTGTVPAELGQLGNLTDLDLSENSGLRGPLRPSCRRLRSCGWTFAEPTSAFRPKWRTGSTASTPPMRSCATMVRKTVR